jgi:4-hydroxy-3-methylbut-2-enyl diphosphate reductase IspH
MIGSGSFVVNISVETESLPQNIVLLPKPRGFCAGVTRAVVIVLTALEQFGSPVYVRKEIVRVPSHVYRAY